MAMHQHSNITTENQHEQHSPKHLSFTHIRDHIFFFEQEVRPYIMNTNTKIDCYLQ